MEDVTISEWLGSLAAKVPTPGGGAVAALSAAIAAAQLSMVVAYTTGKEWEDRAERMKELEKELETFRAEALALVQEDEIAFSGVSEAYQLPKTDDEEKFIRKTTIQQALSLATIPPTKTAQLAIRLLDIATELAASGNPGVISDVAVGASMARSALESAIFNIQINEIAIKDPETKEKLQKIVNDANQLIHKAARVNEIVLQRMASK